MNSKEAFQQVSNKVRNTSRWYENELKLIQQDLDKLNKLEKENQKLKKAIKVFADYILVCKPIDFNIYLHSLCDDTKIQLITELLEEVLSNE